MGMSGPTSTSRISSAFPEARCSRRLRLAWKPGRKTEFDLGYQFLNTSGSRAFSDSLVIGDNEFFGDIDLNTKLGSDNATLQFKYSIFAKERHNIGLAIGLGAIFFSAEFDGSAERLRRGRL